MKASALEPPAIFALQAEEPRGGQVPNRRVTAYEEQLGAEFGVSMDDVHLATAGTTTIPGDSAED
ncbi:hypothetical protein GO001_18790 [Streptomyces sp. NRRL B-1677]|uniref:Uncharacterized protein n=1 Tax=Streptomyces klenkii TaxID=1420899 RepID=A0A3B0BYK6_9ACTN|nr:MULTISPECIES: hypothetical protein [Streptomyces]MBF6047257.1 hypothetical protein [Streptomyces sp. NRRL B-1677]RKN77239.1 hypothetical protein D7231_00365 [Streptomyces klenkii]